MRTTVNISDDVLLAVQERARREKRAAGDVLSDLARQALQGRPACKHPAHTGSDRAERHGFRPLPHRGVTVTNALVNQLREDEGV